MTRGGSPQEIGEVLARARERAGVREVPTVGEAAAPPAAPVHEPKACSSCGAPIFWGQLPSRKSMPVNAEPSADGNVRLLDRRGSVLAFVLTGDELARARAAGARLRTSHFATCANAAQHRRKR